jgi:uncharacterized protein YndB with AHSA1/START domain
MPERPSLTIKRRLKAPPAKVWSAWTKPELLLQWFGPDGGPVLVAETDVRVGGRFHMAFCTEDGERHDVSGVYREVVWHEKLVFSWAWKSTPERESQVTVALRPDAEGTLLTLLHEQFFDEAARDNHRRGWTGAIDKLQAFVDA